MSTSNTSGPSNVAAPPKRAQKKRTAKKTASKAKAKPTAKKTTKKSAKKPSPPPQLPRTDPPVKLSLAGKGVFDGPISELFAMVDGKQDGPSLKQRLILACLKKSPKGLTVDQLAQQTGMLTSTIGLISKSDVYNGLQGNKLITVDEIEPQNGESGKHEIFKITAAGKKVV